MIRTRKPLPQSKMPISKMGLPERLIQLQWDQEQTIKQLAIKQNEVNLLNIKLKLILSEIAEEIKKL